MMEWHNGKGKSCPDCKIIKRNKEIVDRSLTQEIQSGNPLTKIKKMFRGSILKLLLKKYCRNVWSI